MSAQTRGSGSQPKRMKVIVIGAGLAGLSCAYELSKSRQQAYDIVILEARDRLGGRVRTLTERFSPGLSAEAGAFWIHHNHKIVNEYLYKLGLTKELEPGGGETLLYHVKGQRFSNAFNLQATSPNMKALERSIGLGGLVGTCLCPHNIGDLASPDWPPAQVREKYKDKTFTEFLRMHQLGGKSITREAVDFMLPWFNWWDDLDKVSALMLIRDSIISRRMCDPAQWFTLKHGMKQIPIRFGEELAKANDDGKRIEINHKARVVGIKQHGASVTATYLLPSGERKDETGDYLVCAIPFSTLREIKPLPDNFSSEKKKAIAEMRYVSVARIYLQYQKPFGVLPDGAGMTDRLFGNLLDMTMVQDRVESDRVIENGNRGRIIQAFIVGEQAKKVSGMNESERADFLQKELEKIFTDPVDNIKGNPVEASDSICWHDEEWSKGAYPSFTPSEFISLTLKDISQSEGRIHFAGDHTSAYPGWMEGALQSGKRAAKEIMDNEELP